MHSQALPVAVQSRSRVWRVRTLAIAIVLCHGRPVIAQAVAPTELSRSLRMLFDSVQVNYPAIRAAQSRVRAAQAKLRTARAFGNPVLSLQVDQIAFPGAQPLIGMPQQLMAMATFPLGDLYQRGPRVAAASAEVRIADAESTASRQRFGLDAAMAFYRAAMAQVEVTIAGDVVSWLDTLVGYNRVRVRGGATAEADLLRSELERDRASAEQAMVVAELAQARMGIERVYVRPAHVSSTTIRAGGRHPFPVAFAHRQARHCHHVVQCELTAAAHSD